MLMTLKKLFDTLMVITAIGLALNGLGFIVIGIAT